MKAIKFVLAVVALIAFGVACTAVTEATAPADNPVAQSAPDSEAAEPAKVTPKASDFKLTIKTLKKSCFGSAGCNVTYRIAPAYNGTPLADDQEFEILYQVTGGDDGPQTNSFTLRGDEISYQSEEFLSTPSSGTKLRGKVTEVLAN